MYICVCMYMYIHARTQVGFLIIFPLYTHTNNVYTHTQTQTHAHANTHIFIVSFLKPEIVLLLCITRISQCISDTIVDGRQTSGIRVPNPSHLLYETKHRKQHVEFIVFTSTMYY
ncbi:hypothetical protein HanRHA438_Chr00c09g0847781 [Helianthus annuus]|nr:hypothetical protein HanRHA438_Chr00c09g0847781 [Helianthus annuus]